MNKIKVLSILLGMPLWIMSADYLNNSTIIDKKENIMQFTYSDTWKEELLKHAYNKKITRNEVHRLGNLIAMADFTKEPKVVETLLLTMTQDDMGGMDQTVENTLSSVDYKAYYEVLFKLIPKYLNKFRYFNVHLLEMTHGNEYPKEEWEYIESVAKKYLNKKIIQEIIESLEKDEYEYDYPYDKFHQLFQKLLKEKSE